MIFNAVMFLFQFKQKSFLFDDPIQMLIRIENTAFAIEFVLTFTLGFGAY